MSASIGARFIVPPPGNDVLKPPNPYTLWVFDHPEFKVECYGDVTKPFNPAKLMHKLELVTSISSTNPDCSLSSLDI